jgi:hypothetical protein
MILNRYEYIPLDILSI